MSDPDFVRLPWRVGRKVGRHIYAVVGDQASDSDPPIGMLDTAELAEEAVVAHNLALIHRLAGDR